MFDNIGKKLMGLAKFLCWVGIISSVIFAIVVFANSGVKEQRSGYGYYYNSYGSFYGKKWLGWVTLILGPLSSWISSWMLYAFGEFVDDTAAIREKLDKLPLDSAPQGKSGVTGKPVSSAPRQELNVELPQL